MRHGRVLRYSTNHACDAFVLTARAMLRQDDGSYECPDLPDLQCYGITGQ